MSSYCRTAADDGLGCLLLVSRCTVDKKGENTFLQQCIPLGHEIGLGTWTKFRCNGCFRLIGNDLSQPTIFSGVLVMVVPPSPTLPVHQNSHHVAYSIIPLVCPHITLSFIDNDLLHSYSNSTTVYRVIMKPVGMENESENRQQYGKTDIQTWN